MKSWRVSRGVVSPARGTKTVDKGVRTSKARHALFPACYNLLFIAPNVANVFFYYFLKWTQKLCVPKRVVNQTPKKNACRRVKSICRSE